MAPREDRSTGGSAAVERFGAVWRQKNKATSNKVLYEGLLALLLGARTLLGTKGIATNGAFLLGTHEASNPQSSTRTLRDAKIGKKKQGKTPESAESRRAKLIFWGLGEKRTFVVYDYIWIYYELYGVYHSTTWTEWPQYISF